MAVQFKISVDAAKALKMLKQLPVAIQKAKISALNKTAAKARTQASRAIRSEYAIKAGELKGKLTVVRATINNPEAIIRGKGKSLLLSVYGARQSSRGVTVRIKKAGGRKRLSHAFIKVSPRVGLPVVYSRDLQRPRKPRSSPKHRQPDLPIKFLYGPGVEQMFRNREVLRNIERVIKQEYPRIFANELQFFQKRAG